MTGILLQHVQADAHKNWHCILSLPSDLLSLENSFFMSVSSWESEHAATGTTASDAHRFISSSPLGAVLEHSHDVSVQGMSELLWLASMSSDLLGFYMLSCFLLITLLDLGENSHKHGHNIAQRDHAFAFVTLNIFSNITHYVMNASHAHAPTCTKKACTAAFPIEDYITAWTMTELNELFEQIFHAELKFKARTDKLKQRECQKSDNLYCTTLTWLRLITTTFNIQWQRA